MSRSNPQGNAPNPAIRWFEWNGEHGTVRYYDKDHTKRNIDLPMPFTFMLLDELAGVRGWHEASNSGIYSNEVRDTTQDALIVKAFKGGVLAEGIYKSIKDRVHTLGGRFSANCYIAAKIDPVGLAICSLRLSGAALNAWVEFRKAHRGEIYSDAISIIGFTEGKKGRVIFRTPQFTMKTTTAETHAVALELDQELQVWLQGYLARRTQDQAAAVSTEPTYESDSSFEPEPEPVPVTIPDDDIPF